jgi:hypothetical protein
MSTDDILADWKTQRFVVIDAWQPDTGVLIILCDITFWDQHYADLSQWCQDHEAKLAGMTVELPGTELLTAFCLRWK